MRNLIPFILLFIIGIPVLGQVENGLPIIKNFSPEDYSAPAQNLTVAQDSRGVLYFGNSGGLLEYDGVYWRTIVTDLYPEVQSLSFVNGKLYIGSRDDFGVLEKDSLGKSFFKSIFTSSKDTNTEFGAVHKIHSVPDSGKIIFQAEYAIFIFDGKSLTSIVSPNRIQESFLHRGILYADIEGVGLNQLLGTKFISTPGSALLNKTAVRQIFPRDSEHLILLTQSEGLMEMHLNKDGYPISLKPYATPLDTFLKSIQIESAVTLGKGLVSVAVPAEGIFIIRDWKEIVQMVNRNSGLQNDLIEGQFVDDQVNLWLALSNGISKIELDYPLTNFSSLNGLIGTVQDVRRFRGSLYSATTAGIYKLAKDLESKSVLPRSSFQEFLPEQCWKLENFSTESENFLLAALNNEVVAIDKNDKVETVYECYPWMVQKSKFHDNLIFIGMDPGLAVILRREGNWEVLAEIADVGEPINSIYEESEESIWLGTRSFGVFQINGFKPSADTVLFDELNYYYEDEGLPEGEVFMTSFKDSPIFGTNNSLYSFNDSTKKFNQLALGKFPDSSYVHTMDIDPKENSWAVIYHNEQIEIGYIRQSDSNWVSETFNPISNEIINAFHFDSDGIVWLGGPKGIFRHDQTADHDHQKDFNTLVRKVYIQKGATEIPVFEGSFADSNGIFLSQQPTSAILDFEHDKNDFVFEFAAQSEANIKRQKYTYKLEGYHSDWRPWKSETKAVYTNLPPKEYSFMVKSLNIFNHESKVATYKFTINPPWWQTGWYYFGQTLFFLVLILLTFFLNRGGGGTKFAEIVAFVTIITVFEFVIMLIEPFFNKYTGGVPVFQLAMNILMAMSLAPIELWLKKYLRRNKDKTELSK